MNIEQRFEKEKIFLKSLAEYICLSLGDSIQAQEESDEKYTYVIHKRNDDVSSDLEIYTYLEIDPNNNKKARLVLLVIGSMGKIIKEPSAKSGKGAFIEMNDDAGWQDSKNYLLLARESSVRDLKKAQY